jgi:2,4-dienoyl-CoA reductase-like NADH-dependent reductase (Old Yellow Enzyme family)/thioredoxin reductase
VTGQIGVAKYTDCREQKFKHLFQPGIIGKMPINNRIIMAAMGNALADEKGNVTDSMLEYYRIRAKGGAGMIITQFASISPDDVMPYNLNLFDDIYITGISRLVQTIHESGAKACIQLMHPGLLLLLFKTLPPSITIKVPSITPRIPKNKPFYEIPISDIEKYINNFTEAASRAIRAGADAVEIHACHGCLLSSFLSPAINQRSDLYGGNVENRVRFLQQIVMSIRTKVEQDIPLIVRINGCDDVEGGVTPDEVIQQAYLLNKAGASAISISSGLEYWSTLMAPSYLSPEGVVIPIAEKLKKSINIPVIVSGKINPELAEKTVRDGKADFIALGRPLLADPELPNKLYQDRDGEISSCLYCNNCLRTSWRSCTVNPFLYRESTAKLSQTSSPKKIMVIGGGLAGMEAAVLCKMRGHAVSLFEKEGALGGQWRVACAIPGKQGYASIINSLNIKLKKLHVPVELNVTVTRELVNENKPDAVIIATGAIPLNLDIPGANESNCVQANDIITNQADPKGNIIVIGGNLVGMEVAVSLAEKGKTVTLVSHSALGGRKGPDDLITFRGLLRKISWLRIPLYLNSDLLEICGKSLVIRIEQEILSLLSDTLVIAIGVKPVDNLVQELKGIVPEIYVIGDSVIPGNAAQATYSAARLALKL